MKSYPSNFKNLQLHDVPVGSLLRMENGKTLTISQHNMKLTEIQEVVFEGDLSEPVDSFHLGMWLYNGKKFRLAHDWPKGMDIVAVVRRGP